MLDIIKAGKSVEDYVNSVSYGEDATYIPSPFALEFVNFIKLVNGEAGEENLTPVLHYKMLDQLAGRTSSILNMLFRGSAKTALFGEYLFLYLGVYGRLPGFGQVDIALYVSDSIENGVKNMRKNLEFRWENSDFLRQYIPSIKFTDIRWQFTNADGKLFIVKGYGAQTGIRGAKEMGKRPTLAVLDDLISDEDARSPTVIKSVEDTVYKAVDYALHPTNNKVIWSGTPFNAKDPLYKAVESGAWAVNVYPVCEKFPCKREEFVGAWEDRFTYDAVKDKYDKALKAGKIDSFNQELMLRIMSDEDRLIQNSDISWYKRSTVLNNKGLFNFYITTDFATSERSSADYSVISVWAYTSNGDWLWIDGIVKRQLMSDNVNDLFRLAQMYAPQQVGIEISGQQGGFISWIQDEMLVRNIYFPLASEGNNTKPGIRPNTNKLVRFNIMVPLFKLNKIKFPIERKESEEMLECIDELSLAAVSGFKSKHDDFCFIGNTQILLSDGSSKAIKDIQENDLVMTLALDTISMPASYVIMTGNKEVKDYFFSNGSVVSMTANHPILTTLGWVAAKDITPETKIIWSNVCKLSLLDISGLDVNQGITNQVVILRENVDGCTNGYGKVLTENNLSGLAYTILMKIKTITLLRTYSYYRKVIIKSIMDFKEILSNKKITLKTLGLKLQSGINQKKVSSGIKKIMQNAKRFCTKRNTQENVLSVVNRCNLILNQEESTALQDVLTFAKQLTQHSLKHLNVSGVKQHLRGIGGKEVVLKNVEIIYLDKKENLRNEDVYNFEVSGSHNYVLANGIIAHNCDTISMLGSLTPWKPSKQSEGLTQDANGIWEEDIEDPVNSLDSYIF